MQKLTYGITVTTSVTGYDCHACEKLMYHELNGMTYCLNCSRSSCHDELCCPLDIGVAVGGDGHSGGFSHSIDISDLEKSALDEGTRVGLTYSDRREDDSHLGFNDLCHRTQSSAGASSRLELILINPSDHSGIAGLHTVALAIVLSWGRGRLSWGRC